MEKFRCIITPFSSRKLYHEVKPAGARPTYCTRSEELIECVDLRVDHQNFTRIDVD